MLRSSTVRALLVLAVLVWGVAGSSRAEGPQRVKVGVFLRNVEALDLERNSYSLSFVLWMRWTGPLDPTASFRFVNLVEAWALSAAPVYEQPLTEPDGSRYQRFNVEGRFFHKFDLSSFPLDWQKVLLELEDVRHPETALVYEPDGVGSGVLEGLVVPGWVVQQQQLEVRSERYPGQLGHAADEAFSRFRFGVTLQRPLRLLLWTMAPPVLLVLLCCFSVLFLGPLHVEARVGTVITALLTVVFLQLAFTDDVPWLGHSVLLDQLFNLSYLVMTAVLLECVVVTRWYDRARQLDERAPALEPHPRDELLREAVVLRRRIERLDRVAARAFPPAYLLGCLVMLAWSRGAALLTIPW